MSAILKVRGDWVWEWAAESRASDNCEDAQVGCGSEPGGGKDRLTFRRKFTAKGVKKGVWDKGGFYRIRDTAACV